MAAPEADVYAIDAASMSWLLLMLTAEFIVLTFTLWLLFRVTWPKTETKQQTSGNPDSAANQ